MQQHLAYHRLNVPFPWQWPKSACERSKLQFPKTYIERISVANAFDHGALFPLSFK